MSKKNESGGVENALFLLIKVFWILFDWVSKPIILKGFNCR